ncbi:MAG: MFS transporter [Planctomycetota bacterium]
MSLASLAASAAAVALPSLARAFDAPLPEVQWVVLAYLLATTTLIVGAGRLGDLLGRRRLLLAGLGLFTAASIVGGLAPSLGVLVAARAAQGLGAATMLALAMALVGEAAPRERAGSAMGLLGAASAVGTSLGPSLGGLLISALGWRAVFLGPAPLAALAWLLARRCLPRDRREVRAEAPAVDVAGTLLLALALAAYALATTASGGWSAHQASLLGVAAAALGLFALVELRAPAPLLRLALLRPPARWGGLAMSALVSTVMMTTLIVGPFYLSGALGLDATCVGLALSAGPLVAALAGVPAGRLVDRHGAWRTGLVGLLGLGAGTLTLATTPLALGVPGYLAPLAVATFGYALFQTANNTAVLGDVGPDQRGVISGALNLARNLGLLTGASAMGAVFAAALGSAELATAPPEVIARGARTTFAVAAGLVTLALATAAATGRHAAARRA